MVDIIIVKYNLPAIEAECIEQIKKVTKFPYKITAYDNYVKDESLSIVWNRLITQSDCDYICLLNNDTVVSEGWLTTLMDSFEINEKIGAAGPISNSAGGCQGGWPHIPHDAKEYRSVNMLSGFCVLFPKNVWAKVGGFEERYKLYGEDNDFFRKIKKAELELIIRYDAWVFHYGSLSTPQAIKKGKDMKAIRQESSQLYQRTWNH